MNNLAFGFQIAILFSGCIIGGIWLGRYVDSVFYLTPLGIISGMLLGTGLAFVAILKILKKKIK